MLNRKFSLINGIYLIDYCIWCIFVHSQQRCKVVTSFASFFNLISNFLVVQTHIITEQRVFIVTSISLHPPVGHFVFSRNRVVKQKLNWWSGVTTLNAGKALHVDKGSFRIIQSKKVGHSIINITNWYYFY